MKLGVTGPGIVKADPFERCEEIQRRLGARGLSWVLDDVAVFHNVLDEEVVSRLRSKRVAAARHDMWARLHAMGFSYPEIGRIFDVDHTTVLSAVHKARRTA